MLSNNKPTLWEEQGMEQALKDISTVDVSKCKYLMVTEDGAKAIKEFLESETKSEAHWNGRKNS